jgi:hypothetical protein
MPKLELEAALFGELTVQVAAVDQVRIMLTGLAGRLADLSIRRAMEADVALRRWRFIRAWKLVAESGAYLDASQRALVIAKNL